MDSKFTLGHGIRLAPFPEEEPEGFCAFLRAHKFPPLLASAALDVMATDLSVRAEQAAAWVLNLLTEALA